MRLLELIELNPEGKPAAKDNGKSEPEFRLPDEIGILPIRSAVAYPGTVMPLAI